MSAASTAFAEPARCCSTASPRGPASAWRCRPTARGRTRRRAPAHGFGGCVMSTIVKSAPIPPSRQREKPGQQLKWIGKNIKRVEDPRLLTGQGRYIDDIDLPNMLHAAVLRSTRAHARIKSIDVTAA